ncbi:MAG: 3-phosphoserine/phosphohydroxythreonine transaminase [Gammaproteobacteria bacterium]|nr:3-phosphoserine/phosphohydroxythreonine transaminase [Gammaproteobacteria bacterium]MBQ0774149.1 3-phosphoserine/phosphohydroxythreonine transaminase [Gammaproteobacteria bacterium]
MTRAFNFCAGPAALPEEVLKKAQAEMLDYAGRGLSVMEMSHRSAEFVAIAARAEQDLRDLLGISDDYAVLFVQGGASQQFSMVPMNLLPAGGVADYVNTGQWSSKAIKEAQRFGDVNVVASSKDKNFSYVPSQSDWAPSKNAAYLHYTPNETIGGVEYNFTPQTNVPLVADYSSSILSRPLDVSKFGLIYAGAQKNIGPAGLTLVIVRKELLGHASNAVPAMLNYKTFADNDSMYNTPPTYGWYLAGLVFAWLKEQGGLQAIGELNQRKADKLYGYIDASGFYSNPVQVDCRSLMNIPFALADDALDRVFLKEAEQAGLLNLAGHRSVGGMRASIYNAVPEAAVDALIDFMKDFAKRNG